MAIARQFASEGALEDEERADCDQHEADQMIEGECCL
jgi:hypothetical protein